MTPIGNILFIRPPPTWALPQTTLHQKQSSSRRSWVGGGGKRAVWAGILNDGLQKGHISIPQKSIRVKNEHSSQRRLDLIKYHRVKERKQVGISARLHPAGSLPHVRCRSADYRELPASDIAGVSFREEASLKSPSFKKWTKNKYELHSNVLFTVGTCTPFTLSSAARRRRDPMPTCRHGCYFSGFRTAALRRLSRQALAGRRRPAAPRAAASVLSALL